MEPSERRALEIIRIAVEQSDEVATLQRALDDTLKKWHAASREKIVAAAIKWGNLVCLVERPGRHPGVFAELEKLNWMDHRHEHVQGFVTSTGRFVERKEARQIAEAADQIIEGQIDKDGKPYKFQHSDLFSEDVW